MKDELARLTADRLTPKLWYSRLFDHIQKTTVRRPLVVGVFQGQSVEEINEIYEKTGIDLIQLHGDEDEHFISGVHGPCIKVLHMTPTGTTTGVSEFVYMFILF